MVMKKLTLLSAVMILLGAKGFAQCNATDSATLVSCLAAATSGTTVYVTGNIDLTGKNTINIPAGVTLQGNYSLVDNYGTGTQLRSNDLFNIANSVPGTPVFIVQAGATIKNIQFRGPVSEFKNNTTFENLLDTLKDSIAPPLLGGSMCFRLQGAGVTITDCEFFGWDKWAIYAYNPGGHVIDRCYFHRNKLQGYGYGVWVGGMGNTGFRYCSTGQSPTSNFGIGKTDQGTTLIKNTIFQDNRHDIAANSGRHSWIADNCSFSILSLSKNIDRHGSEVKTLASRVVNGVTVWDTIPGTGGDTTSVKNSRFYALESVGQLQFPNLNCDSATGQPNPGRIIFENNHFKNSSNCNGEYYIAISGMCSDSLKNKYPNVIQMGGSNTFASAFPNTAKVKVCGKDSISGISIVSDTTIFPAGNNAIYFRPDSSYDSNGNAGSGRMRYVYHYNNMQSFFDNREIVSGNTATHAYYDPGMYVVTMHGVDSLNYQGSDFAIKPFYIKPTDGKVHLVANIKDDHAWSDTATGVVKQLRFNNAVVWQDDIDGDEGWQRIDVDVTNYLNTGTLKDTFFFELILTQDVDPIKVRGVSVVIDDVYINSPTGNNMLKDGSFELYNSTWVSYWKRKSEVIAADGVNLPTKHRVILTASSSDDTQKGGLWSGFISLSSLDKRMWNGRKYKAGSKSKIYQVFKYPNIGQRQEEPKTSANTQVNIYPNPSFADENLTIETSGFEESVIEVSIYNAAGARLFEKRIASNGREEINCKLTPGIYYAYFKSSSNVEIKKLITVE